MKTKEFNLKLNKVNRPILESHVKNLAKSMLINGYWEGKPIQVNEKLEILDGHHRYLAAKKLQIPYYYVIEKFKGKDIDAMIQLNLTARVLNGSAYSEMYAKSGNNNYIELVSLLHKKKLTFTHLIIIFSNIDSARKIISSGKFIFDNSRYDLYNDIIFINDRINFGINKNLTLAIKSLYLFDKKNGKNYVAKIKENVFGIIKNGDVIQYCEQFCYLINKNKKKGKLYFAFGKFTFKNPNKI